MSARAAAFAYVPPEPMATMPSSSGVMTLPCPSISSVSSRPQTISDASSRRSARSVRQSLASSTAARVSWPGNSPILFSSFSINAMASAVLPAKPMTTSSLMRRSLHALDFATMRSPSVTWRSPMSTTVSPFRTARIVVCRDWQPAMNEVCRATRRSMLLPSLLLL
ncbi:conserved exported protein of unknown function [Trypanosoma grayi]|uniref:conserved exported protein of unknown function n=1 Tax=Trypanosoma grayi TaxID=71804 RepID=UPI0004F3FCF6|nr:conserved exported protein of unknown function [Trypanosoma grayi]KEG11161.1 conserved exported protein of unknown function [Trypanosoma grayi]